MGPRSSDTATVTLRQTRDGDVAALCAIANRANVHDRIAQVLDESELAEELAEVDPLADVRVAEIDGVPVGHVRVHHFPSSERLERSFVFGEVDPQLRGRGAGRALLEWASERGRDQLRSSGNDLPKPLLVEAYEQVEDARRQRHFPQDAALIGRVDGWIGVLGTRAAHRGRGLASGMIAAGSPRGEGNE